MECEDGMWRWNVKMECKGGMWGGMWRWNVKKYGYYTRNLCEELWYQHLNNIDPSSALQITPRSLMDKIIIKLINANCKISIC